MLSEPPGLTDRVSRDLMGIAKARKPRSTSLVAAYGYTVCCGGPGPCAIGR